MAAGKRRSPTILGRAGRHARNCGPVANGMVHRLSRNTRNNQCGQAPPRIMEHHMSVSAPPGRRARTGGWLADRPIGVKIGAVVGLLVVVLLGTGALSVTRMHEMSGDQQRIYDENLRPLNALSAVQRATAAYRARVLEYAVSDPARRGELLGEMDEKMADADAALAEYEPFVISQEAMGAYT